MRTLRFNDWCGSSPVRLGLRDGQRLEWSRVTPHEEGWSSECIVWERRGWVIVRETTTDGRDCDGRLSTHHTVRCRASRLSSRVPPADVNRMGLAFPEWEEVSAGQRDYAAEAAGY